MDAASVLALGLGVTSPWRLADQRLDTDKKPHVLEIALEAERGAQFPCPDCGKPRAAHDFKAFTWRHLNFFQHHCMITARVPRTDCAEHGVKRVKVPWARQGSGFTLLFEQAAMVLVREMPVLAAARIIAITDKRLWRIVEHYVAKALEGLVLSGLTAVAFDETASKKGHNYVTVFIDADRERDPVVFATPGKGKATVAQFRAFLKAHGGEPGRIVELVCDMSPAFLAAVGEQFPAAAVTVDWFHVVQLFTLAVDDVRKAERKQVQLPVALRWAVLKAADGKLTKKQAAALAELQAGDFLTAVAWRIKEKLRWVRPGRNPARRALAALPLPAPRPRADRRRPTLRGRPKGPGNGRDPSQTDPGALGVEPLKRPIGGHERIVPGGPRPRQGLPQHRHLHHHDLPDRSPTRKSIQIHLMRRRAN